MKIVQHKIKNSLQNTDQNRIRSFHVIICFFIHLSYLYYHSPSLKIKLFEFPVLHKPKTHKHKVIDYVNQLLVIEEYLLKTDN